MAFGPRPQLAGLQDCGENKWLGRQHKSCPQVPKGLLWAAMSTTGQEFWEGRV
jgi:hypothetical protein